MREAMKKKRQKVRCLGYMVQGPDKSLTSFFMVPKGDDDVRMVWAPWCPQPTIETHLRFVDSVLRWVISI